MKDQFKKLCTDISVIPIHLFPFPTKVDGKIAFGTTAYNEVLKNKKGFAGTGYPLSILTWREFLHSIVAIVFVTTVVGVQTLFQIPHFAMIMIAAAIMGILFQELYVHPKLYGQKWERTIIDIVVWVTPLIIFIFLSF